MNIAIIFAGGTGTRMNSRSKPKQFLEVHGKPVLIYTMENFQNHPLIDKIILVCVKSWIGYAQQLISKYDITKVVKVISGGATGQASIYRGLKAAKELYGDNHIVLIHDGVRPLIDQTTITNCIQEVEAHGNAITVSPAVETIYVKSDDNKNVGTVLERSRCEMARAPQCFILNDIFKAHEKANEEGRRDFVDSASLMQYYGYDLYTVDGPAENIKITTPSDFYIFRAILDAKENSQIWGL